MFILLRRICIWLFLAFPCSSQMVFGQNRVWCCSSGDWNVAANWVQVDVPNSAGEIAILGGVGAYNVTYDLSTTLSGFVLSNPNASLTFNPSVSNSLLSVNSDFSVDGVINLNSDVDGRDVTLLRAGSITNSVTGMINFGGTSSATATLRQLQVNQFNNNGIVNVNQNGLFNRNSGIFTNNNIVNIAAGKSLTFGTNNVFNQDSGTVSNQGTFEFNVDTLNFNGGSFSGNAVELVSSALNIGSGSFGSGTFSMSGSGSYSGDLATVQTVNIRSTAVANSMATATADFTNHGTINLVSDFDDRDVTLLRAGNVTNSATGTINLGGASETANTLRQLQVNQFSNNGTVNVNQSGLFNRNSGIFINNNSVNIATGKSLTFGSNNVFNQNSGTVSNQGTFEFNVDTLNFNGGTFSGNAVELVSSALNIGSGSVGSGTFNMNGSGSYSGDLATVQTVNIRSTLAANSMTTAIADFTNHGTINLVSDFDDRDVTLLRAGSVTNSATGAINLGGTSSAANTLRQLQIGQLNNNGTVNVLENGLFNRNSGIFTNNSSVNIALGKSLTLGSSNVFNQNSGTVNNQGTFEFSGDTLNFNGGSFSGNAVNLVNSTLNIGSGSVGTGTFNMSGSGSFSGDLATVQTVNIRSTAPANSMSTATADFTNHGTINLVSDFDDRDVTLLRAGSITNSATGTINLGGTSAAANTLRQLQISQFNNNGTVNVDQNGQFNRNSGIFTNNNSVNIAVGKSLTLGSSNVFNQNSGTVNNQGTFEFSGDTLNFNGGSFSGNAVSLVSSALKIGSGSVGTGTFNMSGSSSYSGDLASAQTVNILSSAAANSLVTATADFTNHGTINLASDFDGRDVTLLRAGTITNSATGTIQFTGTSSAGTTDRHLSAQLVNAGTVDIVAQGTATRIGATGDSHTNSGLIVSRNAANVVTFQGSSFTNQAGGTLAGLGELDFSQTSLVNNGIIAPGLSAGTLTLDGNAVFGATANLQIEIGGLLQGISYDYVEALDNVTLNGGLSVNFISGFQNLVSSADSFTVLTAGGLNGIFSGLFDGTTLATSDGYGSFQINYIGNSVVLSNFSAVPEPSTWMLVSLAAMQAFFRRNRTAINSVPITCS